MNFVVALTGGIGSGKSVASDYFKAHGIEVIDTDVISRELVTPGSDALQVITKQFGPHILNNDGTLNRKKCRQEIFSDPIAKKWLEDLLHPLIHQEVLNQIQNSTSPCILIVIPLLAENFKQYENLIDYVLVIESSPTIQSERIQKRDHIDKVQADQHLKNQTDNQSRRKIANKVIQNNASLHDFYQALEQTLKEIDEMTGKK